MDIFGEVKLILVIGKIMKHLKTYTEYNFNFPIIESKDVENFSRDLLKLELKSKIDSLPDSNHYLTHVTSPEFAKSIFETQFKFNLGTGLSGTTAITNKSNLYTLLSNMIDGISPHRNQLGCFLLAMPKSEFGEISSERRVSIDTIENDLLDNYQEFSNGNIPVKFNYGYFDGEKLITK
jgi:hypothetical protein